MVGSLVSVLKKPFQTQQELVKVQQGSFFILSKISGDDKCKYAVFSSANCYKIQRKRKTDDACWVQDTPVSRCKLLSADKSACMKLVAGIYGLVSKAKTGL
jgi:hypothetical protein